MTLKNTIKEFQNYLGDRESLIDKNHKNIAGKILIGLGIITIIISLIKGNWILPIALTIFGLIFFADFKLKERKEINRLTDKMLEFHKSEYE